EGPEAMARTCEITALERAWRPSITFSEGPVRALGDYHAVLMRKDPPFALDFYFATLLLERARGKTLLVNDPRGLRDANEKLYAMNFAEFIPPTIVTREASRLRRYMDELGGDAIVKPLDGSGGRGVFHLRTGDRNVPSILEISTDFG